MASVIRPQSVHSATCRRSRTRTVFPSGPARVVMLNTGVDHAAQRLLG